ncbi:hypothetical protein [Hymenobacter jeollabukensis]|nr:hypothetical protein [Hymenobacter jeollabukensis]
MKTMLWKQRVPGRRPLRQVVLGGVLLAVASCQPAGRSAELLRLEYINDALLATNAELWRTNEHTLRAIHAQVDRNQRQPSDTLALRRAEAVHDSTRHLLGYLQSLRERLLRATGNAARFEHLDAHREVADLLGAAVVDSLQIQLRRHDALLRQPLPPAAGTNLASGATLAPEPAAFDFTDAPLVAVLAALAERESRALLDEETVLAALRARTEAGVLKPTPRPLAIAVNATVAPGATYRATLLLTTALNANRTLKMTCNGQPISVDAAGYGQVAFVVPALPSGLTRRRAEWTGTITHRYLGRDTTFHVRVPYTIVRGR